MLQSFGALRAPLRRNNMRVMSRELSRAGVAGDAENFVDEFS